MSIDTLLHTNFQDTKFSHFNKLKFNMDEKTVFGFWIYLMSDCIMFCVMFATNAVLNKGIANGPTGKDIFELSFILIETFLLLLSSFSYSFVYPSILKYSINKTIFYSILAWLFGFCFIGMEFYEFYNLIIVGYGPDCSGFLSSFFVLTGTHSIHIISGLIWMIVLIIQILKFGFTKINNTRVICFSLFWHFLDIIWICIFSFIYLIGCLD